MFKQVGKALSILATAVAAIGPHSAFAEPRMPGTVSSDDVAGVYSAHDPKYLRYNAPSGARHAGNNMNWVYNDTNRPASMPKATAIASIQNAMAKWSAVCGITFTYGGETTTPFSISYNGSPASSSYDGVKVVGWDTTIAAPTTGITFVAWNGAGTLIDSEIRFNATYTVGFDFTALHEVGHALGLDHSDQNGAVMSGPPLSSYNGLSTLQADDIAGCVSLYGAAGGGGPAPDTTAPSVPTSLNATPVSTTRIDLSWTGSTDNVGVTGYNVYNGGSLIGNVSGTSTAVTGLAAGTSYTFRVAACDAANNCSAQSSPVTASTLAATSDTQAPTVPANLVATATGQTTVSLTWNASTDNVGVANYRVFQGASQIGTVGGASASVTGLSPGTSYTFRVSACDAAGNCSAQSASASATTQAAVVDTQAPSTPTGLVATAASSSSINLAWNASTDNVGVTQYRIYRGGAFAGSSSSASASMTGLNASTSYSFTVQACDAAGNCSGQSTQASATTLASGPTGGAAPAVPLNLVATTTNSSTITLSWLGPPTGTITYKVYRDGNFVLSTPQSNAAITGLSPSTTYTFTVQSCDPSNNCSAQSTPASARTLGGTTGTPVSYQDLWWANESGWGISITQHDDRLFIALYIYDATGKPVWVVLTNGTWDTAHTSYTGSVYIPTGSSYANYDASRFSVGAPVGTITVKFTNTSTGTLTYSINGASGTKAIARLPFGIVNSTPITDYSDAWWAGATENGWGLVLSQQYHNIFAAWYTYDSNGQTTWYFMPDGTWTTPTTYSGKLYRTRGSQVLGATYNPAALSVIEVGQLTLTFTTSSTGTMTYSVDGFTQTKSISRLAF